MNLLDATRLLSSAGVEDPRVDAEFLLAAAHGVDRAMLPAVDRPPPPLFDDYVRRRAAREPVAYILESAGFFGETLRVTPAVLIPRPETEILVERALALAPKRVLDIGTGSGAIAVALARRGVAVTAIDTSDAALEIARANAGDLPIRFAKADVWLDGVYDLVVSNPPYIPSAEIDGLQPEVRREPRLALDGGSDGLDVIRRILALRRPCLVEIGAGQASPVREIALQSGFRDVRFHGDLAGIERVLEAR